MSIARGRAARDAAALAIVCLAGGIACGGGADEASITREEFIRRADAICAKGQREADVAVRKLQSELGGEPPSREQIGRFVRETFIPITERENDEIRAMPIPEGDEEQVAELREEADRAIARIKADPESYLEIREEVFARVKQLDIDYGLRGCAGVDRNQGTAEGAPPTSG